MADKIVSYLLHVSPDAVAYCLVSYSRGVRSDRQAHAYGEHNSSYRVEGIKGSCIHGESWRKIRNRAS